MATRIAAIALGIACLGCVVFLSEPQEDILENSLVRLWAAVESRREVVGGKSAAFVQQVFSLTERGFDRVLGSRLVGARTVIVSAGLSIVSFILLLALPVVLSDDPENTFWARMVLIAVAIGFLALSSWRMIAVTASRAPSIALSFALAAVVVYLIVASFRDWRTGGDPWDYLKLLIYLVIGITCDVIFVAITRSLCRRGSGSGQLSYLLTIAGITLLIGSMLLVPFFIMYHRINFPTMPPDWLWWIGMPASTNLFPALTSISVWVVALAALVHRVTWPVLQAPIENAYSFHVIKNKKLLFTAGMALVSYGFFLKPLLGR